MGFRILMRSLFVFALICASTHGAQAGIASFIDGCVANIRDFSQLGARLEASGMKEIDRPKVLGCQSAAARRSVSVCGSEFLCPPE